MSGGKGAKHPYLSLIRIESSFTFCMDISQGTEGVLKRSFNSHKDIRLILNNKILL